MKNDLPIQTGITIPAHELEITASRSSGAGGQHVNKTDTRITVRWNIVHTSALDEYQKERVLKNLHSKITAEGDLIIHNSESRSQMQNKRMALEHLAQELRGALYVPKKRMATRISKAAKASRLEAKAHRGAIKKARNKKITED